MGLHPIFNNIQFALETDYLVEHAINAFQCRHLCVCAKMAAAHKTFPFSTEKPGFFAATATTIATIHNRGRELESHAHRIIE